MGMLFSASRRSKVMPKSRCSAVFHSFSMLDLRRGQERAGGIGHQRQHAPRIALAVAGGVEQTQRRDRLFERAVAALRVGVALAVVRQRRDDLDAALAQPFRQSGVARQQEDRQVAAVDDVLAARVRFIDEVAELADAAPARRR